MSYTAPVERMKFALEHLADLDRLLSLEAFEHVTPDVVDAVLDGAARFAGDVLAPLNARGDREGAELTVDGVRAPGGFREAYRRFVADGWPSLAGAVEYGGQRLPTTVHAAVTEMWSAANHAFAMCPELALGAARALEHHGTAEIQQRFLPRIVTGEWPCTMCLSEPQAGSDLAGITTLAEPDGDLWRLRGRKIYISWGEHDLTDNILHFILARTADAPSGVKGLSLFLVPRYWIDATEHPGEPNDIRAVSIERKMGIHASPTCVMTIGEQHGARGWLVGERHQGIACMFTMMNHMRLAVGLQAVGIADHACQIAVGYARERIQGRDARGRPAAIIAHADVRRMLLEMRALTDGCRGLCYSVAALLDMADHAASPQVRQSALSRADLLTPIVKAWGSDMGIEVTSLGVQVLGGAGYLEDTLAAQLYRDVRITAIYEGTNGIQAQDLLGRKVARDEGRALQALMDEIRQRAGDLEAQLPGCTRFARILSEMVDQVEAATAHALAGNIGDRAYTGAIAVDYLKLVGYVCIGWQWAKLALATVTAGEHEAMRRGVLDCARFYGAHVLPRARAHAAVVLDGGASVAAVDADLL